MLTGEGATFCAGADISSLREPGESPQGLAVRAEEALAAFAKPTLAAVRGYCVGGGCQLAAACDLRFAETDALFGVTPAKLGIVYPASSTRRLVSLVGPSAAKYLLFSGELIDTERALRTGLVDEVLPPGELGKRVAEFTRVLATRSQLTQAAAKEFATGARTGTRTGRRRRTAAATPRRASPPSWSGGRRTSPGPCESDGVSSPGSGRLSAPRRQRSTIWAGAFSGDPASYGGCGSYSVSSWTVWASSSPRDPAEQSEPHVDAGRDAGGGDVLAVEHHPLPGRLGAERVRVVEGQPVRGGPAALEESGGGEEQRAGAHGGGPGAGGVRRAQPVEQDLSPHLRGLAGAAGHHARCRGP